jgi:pyridoxal phosphate enzyme (YggS family)
MSLFSFHCPQPLLVAVSKTKPSEAIEHAYAAGARHFGENYVQELVDKASLPSLSASVLPELRWHFIGHLQTNKCKMIAKIPQLALVESVDSEKLATALDKACASAGRPSPLPVLIQVNTSGELSKYGCEPAATSKLFKHVLDSCPQLQPQGLMTIGRLADGPQPDCFDTLKKLGNEICNQFGNSANADAAIAAASSTDATVPAASSSFYVQSASSLSQRRVDASNFILSMGMSGDWECALEHGATELRIGSTIFGARDYGNKTIPPPKEEE